MKFSDFRLTYMERNTFEGSVYFNKNAMIGYNRLANYFDIYFATGVRQSLDKFLFNHGDMQIYNNLFDEAIMRKINAMGEMIYDENNNFANVKNDIDHDENKKLVKFIITCNLLPVYYSKLVSYCSIIDAEKRLEKLIYEAALYWKVDDILDFIVTRGKLKDKKPTNIRDNMTSSYPENNQGGFANTYKSNTNEILEYDDDYDYNRAKERTLIRTLLKYNVTYCHNFSVKKNLLEHYRTNCSVHKLENEYHNEPNFLALSMIKDTILNISMLNMELETKDKLLKSLNKIVDSEDFTDERTFLNLKAVLEYQENNRPNHKCDKIVSMFKDDYPFTGKVYHGFSDIYNYGNSPTNVLRRYVEGYISCSKDIRVARNFARMKEFDEKSKGVRVCDGAVLEINITEEHVAVDIEQILADQNIRNEKLYSRLYSNYIKEREVMVKLPVVTYNILHKDEVERRIREIEDKEEKEKENESK